MKFLISFFLVSSAMAAEKPMNTFDKIQSLNVEKDEVVVTMWSTNRVFRMSKDNHVVPCLENAFKADQRVAMDVNKEAGLILDCKLAGPAR
ncbi:MAG TPA: hypothetical protein VNJ01_01260 [Bacteriovoracaceae bacterium]|nr:hypothetical protein [Bacteriovoracaceae bacterium]